jgi:outer membrane protein
VIGRSLGRGLVGLVGVCGWLVAAPAWAQQAAPDPGRRLGFVNTDRLLRETPGAARADSLFQREFAQWQAQLNAMEDTLRRLIADYDRQQVTLTPEAKEKRQQEIRQKQAQYQQLEADLTRRAEQRRAELLNPIMRRILDAVEAVRQEKNLSLVFSAEALVAADTTLDVTNDVIRKLRAAADTASRAN